MGDVKGPIRRRDSRGTGLAERRRRLGSSAKMWEKKDGKGATGSTGWRLALSGFDSVVTRVECTNGAAVVGQGRVVMNDDPVSLHYFVYSDGMRDLV